ncbi:branched-chain amino acid ABC transporter permease [Terasakiella sp. SH-1]|uniref:branched-chain amino acid ABC transporter permease n=1 Tax=Terasakiella sp. SH-1 TaxID=2560057 RepID=UPI001072F075|nr:branched-chain amino acid ABC transporter permease [Terasakiella sp. SH-1]
MAGYNMMRCGEFRTTYEKDTTIFPTPTSKKFAMMGVILCIIAPLQIGEFSFVSDFMLSLMIQIGYMSIGALGLNILVGFTGQISLGHAAFFGFGAFASAWMSNEFSIPVFFTIPLAGLLTMAVGMMFGMPAARIKGLYLAIATLASQFILEDFFARAEWFTGGSAGALANPFEIFGFALDTDRSYYYVVLVYVVIMYIGASNLMRSRDGRAFVAVRDHYLSAEVMGINLTWYRVLSFGISSFYAGVAGALYAHYLQYVSVESFNLLLSIQFIGMIIIGGLGSVMGSMMGTVFMVLLPEIMQGAAGMASAIPGVGSGFMDGINFLKEMTVGLAIVLFLIFEPEGLAHRWRMTKAYWKLYPFSY